MDWLHQILVWLDAEAVRFHALTWLMFLATVALALAPSCNSSGTRLRSWAHPAWFVGAVILTLCACRWPTWFAPNELNPDESQMLAGAITLRDFPVYWKHVDGTTHGPLTDYFLLVFAWLGLPLNYVTARAAATVLQAVSLLGVWGAVRRTGPEVAARVGILPGVAFWSFTHWADHVHYSSGLVPIALIAAALWLLVGALAREDWTDAGTIWRAGLGGLALGAVPFAKLHLALVGLALGLGALGCWVWQRSRPGALRAAWACAVGALTIPLVVAVFLAIYGLWPQFWIAYIQSNLGYVGHKPTGFTDMISDFFGLLSHGYFFVWFCVPAIGYALWQGQKILEHERGFLRTMIWLGWALTAVALISIILPGRMFSHYLQIAVVPVLFVTSLHLASITARRSQTGLGTASTLAFFLFLTVAPLLWRHYTGFNIYLGHYAANRILLPLPESRYLLERASPGDRLAMWGWHAQVHVETGLPQGTRDAHTAFHLYAGPLREFYRARYLRDITRNRPRWFVDAVRPQGFGFTQRQVDGHETFAPLADFVASHYEFMDEIEGCRIYRLRDEP